jgi:hypothetical protein
MAEKNKLDAIDILNWDYLVKIGEFIEPDDLTAPEAIRAFAYSFVSTASDEVRQAMLTSILVNSTRWCTTETNEEYVAWLARMLKSDLKLLRDFARQVGVRLRRC